MHYAHDSLLRSFNADPELFVALPTGSGSTGAIEKAMKITKEFEKENHFKPIVYLTPYEHHSNILPWVEYYDKLEVLSCDHFGNLVLSEIEEQLKNSPAKELIVSVSAASNVTSTLTDMKGLNSLISTSHLTQKGSEKSRKLSSLRTVQLFVATMTSISKYMTNLTLLTLVLTKILEELRHVEFFWQEKTLSVIQSQLFLEAELFLLSKGTQRLT